MVAVNSKDTLARLLATENIQIEHRAVDTASFDTDKRLMILPIWKDLTDDILTLICAHEISHCLYSPSLELFNDSDLPFSWINCVEDARVEKLIKKRYPGLAGNFYRGYKELVERNFFETDGRELSSFSLIDRINLHFKSVPFVPFKDEEKQFVDMVSECETFDDVLDAVRKIYEYCQEQEEEQEFEDLQLQLNSDEEGNQQGQSVSQTEESDSGEDQTQSKSTGPDSRQASDEEGLKQDKPTSQDPVVNTQASETDSAWRKKQSELIDENAKSYVYLGIPKVNLDELIISSQDINKALTIDINSYEQRCSYNHWQDPSTTITRVAGAAYDKFKQDAVKSVNYLVKEFEMRKSADEYKRSSVAKTGVIDTNTLHSYKWNEDIFKKLTITPGAKNHGMIFFLDWSGSMSEFMDGTIRQLYNLIWFCRKVQIPFEVYAFAEPSHYNSSFGKREVSVVKSNDISVQSNCRLFELFLSTMSNKQLDDQMKKVWILASRRSIFRDDFHMGGTPLIEAIIAAKDIANNFLQKNRVQKLNFVFLTDGESNPIHYWIANRETTMYGNKYWARSLHYQNSSEFFLRDNGRTYKICRHDYFEQTKTMLEWLSDHVDANIIGFRLIIDRDARRYVECRADMVWEDSAQKSWRKDGSYSMNSIGGFDELYLIRLSQNLGADTKEIEFDADAKKSEIRKVFSQHMRSKQYNKTILNKFIGAIA
jgi:hypothetical protein